MKLSDRHQGGLKNWGECRAGRGTRGEELPASISYFSGRAIKQGRLRMGVGWEQRTGISNRVRWLNYCYIIPRL